MNLLEQAEALANELRFAAYVRNKLDGIRMVHEHERQTFERILRLALERICQRCRGYGKTASGCHCTGCDGLSVLPVGKAHAETTPAPERAEDEPTQWENTCEHGDHAAPAGQRFCSEACQRCEHTLACGCPVDADCPHPDSEDGCSGLCGRDDEGNLIK